MFKKNNIYSTCTNSLEYNYSNKFFIDYFNETFKDIDNLVTYNIKRGEIYYDSFDGHKNLDNNKKTILKIVEKIKELSIKY